MSWWERLREQLRDDLSTPAARAVPSSIVWEPGIDVVESPFLPPNTFIVGAYGQLGTRMWDDVEPFRISEPLWPPAPVSVTNRRAFAGEPAELHDVYLRERGRALAHLERTLDTACDHFGMDPEVAWKGPRRDQTRREAYERQQLAVMLEARYAFAVRRPTDFAKITTT